MSNKDIPEEAWEISAGIAGDRGVLWITDNTDTTRLVPDDASLEEMSIPAGNVWIDTAAEFERLYTKALADGLAVQRENS